MKLEELLSTLTEATFKLDPWAEVMLKAIHSVDDKVDASNMGSEDGHYVKDEVASKITKQMSKLGYKLTKDSNGSTVITSKDDSNKGVTISSNPDVPGEKALNFWAE